MCSSELIRGSFLAAPQCYVLVICSVMSVEGHLLGTYALCSCDALDVALA